MCSNSLCLLFDESITLSLVYTVDEQIRRRLMALILLLATVSSVPLALLDMDMSCKSSWIASLLPGETTQLNIRWFPAIVTEPNPFSMRSRRRKLINETSTQ